jgi:small GTP-binding protein
MSEEDYTYLFKVVIIGDSGVGKSNIFTRFIKDEFNLDSKATIGVEFSAKNITINDKVIKAQVWDTAGQERFRALAKNYYRGAVGALVVYDITNYDSFKNAEKWLKEVKEHAEPHLVTLLIGNKCDLEENRAVKTEDATEFAEKAGLGFVETSAKNNLNIDSAFNRLVTEVFETLDKVGGEEDNTTTTTTTGKPVISDKTDTITIGTTKRNQQADSGCAC